MATIFFIFIILTFCHFFIESTVVPVLQDSVKKDFYKLYIDATRAADNTEDKSDSSHLREIAYSAKSAIEIVDLFNLFEYARFKKSYNKSTDTFYKNKANYDVRKYFAQYNKLVRKSFVVNMQGWSVYIFPVVFFILFFSHISGRIRDIRGKSSAEVMKAYSEELGTHKKKNIQIPA